MTDERKACLALAAALVAGLAATARAAEMSFEDKVIAVFAPQSWVKSAVQSQKTLSTEEAAQAQKDVEADAVDRGGPGGPGPRPPSPRPNPGPRPNPRPNPTPRPNPNPRPGPRPGPHPGPRPGPIPHPHPAPRPPEHPTHPLPPDHRHGDWGHWPGHPGWGHHHDGWEYDRWGRAHWWGWIIWSGERRAECLDYYGTELRGCNDSCADENDQCVQECGAFGDADCEAQCETNTRYCDDSCQEDYDQRVNTCPAF